MLFVNKNDFAIEAIIEPGLVAPSAAWGRMCVHVGDLTLGDFSDPHCGLGSSVECFKQLQSNLDDLWDDQFDGKSPAEIHDTVRHAIYGDDNRTMAEVSADSQRFGVFDFLTNWGEQFDGFASVIVRPNLNSIMILHRSANRFHEAKCSKDGFCSAIEQFVSWLEDQERYLKTE